jgi:hypothetical protein
MGKQLRTYRTWKDVQFVAGGSDTVDLPLGFDLETIHLYLAGSINVTVAYTAVRSEGISKLVKRIDVIADGETIATMPGDMLFNGNFMRPYPAIKSVPGFALANYPYVEAVGFLDFVHIDGINPKDSILRTAGMRQLQLRITWGTLADLYTGAGAATVAIKMGVYVRETKELGNEFGRSKSPEIRRLHRYAEKAYPTSTQDRIPLDTGMLYRAIVLRAESLAEPSKAVITNIKVIAGSDVLLDMPASALYDANCNDNAMALPPGYYVVDLSPGFGNSKIADFLDLTGRNDAFLVLDVVGGATNKVSIMSHEFEWLHKNIQKNEIEEQEKHEFYRKHG